MEAGPEHEDLFQELLAVLRSYEEERGISAPILLAITANIVGKILALQDQGTMSPERAMKIVILNIEIGNKQMIDELHKTIGSA